jgi:mannose-6-phosphate isomerase-like protein (cupin superfamily)
MARDASMLLSGATLGTGVVNPLDYCRFAAHEPMVVPMYNDQDQGIVVWNLEPGQENTIHVHAGNAHGILVLQGNGAYVKGEADLVPITAGNCIIVPRGTPHGIRNTGQERLSYLAFTTAGEGGYVRGNVGS